VDDAPDAPLDNQANARGLNETVPGVSGGASDFEDGGKLRALPILIGVIGALLIAGLARPHGLDTGPRNMASWDPTVHEILQTMPVGHIAEGDERVERFNRLLTTRYRQRLLAVRVILHPPDRIEIRCGANINRRVMARIAVQTESDAHTLFSRPFDVDVYETYVAAPKRKIAELRRNGPASRPTLTFGDERWSEYSPMPSAPESD